MNKTYSVPSRLLVMSNKVPKRWTCSSRWHNGEVQMYDSVLSVAEFITQWQAMAEKWADIPLPIR